jgi:hypothetical protein
VGPPTEPPDRDHRYDDPQQEATSQEQEQPAKAR